MERIVPGAATPGAARVAVVGAKDVVPLANEELVVVALAALVAE